MAPLELCQARASAPHREVGAQHGRQSREPECREPDGDIRAGAEHLLPAASEWPTCASRKTITAPKAQRSGRNRRQGKGKRSSAAAVAPLTANAVAAIAHHGPVVRNCRVPCGHETFPQRREVKARGAQVDLQRQRRQHTAGDGAGIDQACASACRIARSDPCMPAILGRDGSNTMMPGLNPGTTRTVAGAARPTDRVSRGVRPAKCRSRRRCRRSRSRRRWWRRGGRCRSRSCRRC